MHLSWQFHTTTCYLLCPAKKRKEMKCGHKIKKKESRNFFIKIFCWRQIYEFLIYSFNCEPEMQHCQQKIKKKHTHCNKKLKIFLRFFKIPIIHFSLDLTRVKDIFLELILFLSTQPNIQRNFLDRKIKWKTVRHSWLKLCCTIFLFFFYHAF